MLVRTINASKDASLVSTASAARTTVRGDRIDMEFTPVADESQLKTAVATGNGVVDAEPVARPGVTDLADRRTLHSDVIHTLASARSAFLRVQADVSRILAQGPVDLVNEVELPILSTVEAVKSELRNPSRVEMARATASDTGCNRVFRRKAPIGQSA